jgi:ankyrin repeat protein
MRIRNLMVLAAALPLLAGAAAAQDIFQATRSGDLEKVKSLVAADPGAVNARDANGRTPLHWACRGGKLEMLDYLAEKGADVNARDRNGTAPLHWAAVSGSAPFVRLLLERRAEPSAADASGDTPLNLAAGRGLMEAGGLLLDAGARLDTAGDKGLVLLQGSARSGWVRLFKVILGQEGRRLFSDPRKNLWTMQDAVSGGAVEIVEALIGSGVTLSAKADLYGWTPLHYAASKGRPAMIAFLARRGVALDARTRAGETATNLAQESGSREALELLASLGAKPGPRRFPAIRKPYFGQKKPGLEPEIFAPGIISRPDFREISLAVGPQGREFYFYRLIAGRSRLFACRMEGKAWRAVEEVAGTSAYSAFLPFLSLDGRRLFFNWENPLSPAQPAIWAAEKKGNGWSEPAYIGQGIAVSQSRDGRLYTTDFSTRAGEGDTCVSRVTLRDGRFTDYEPQALPAGGGSQAHPCVAPDGSYLIFDNGGGDHLQVSFRKKDGAWGEAIDLTRHGFEPLAGLAAISPDGKYLFFKQGCRGPLDVAHSETNRDIWWVDIGVIERLRPKE